MGMASLWLTERADGILLAHMSIQAIFLVALGSLFYHLKTLLHVEENANETDPLTGLLNRRSILVALKMEQGRSQRYGQPFTLLYFDIDDFKNLNHSKGHEYGDKALQALVSALKSNTRQTDILCRIGSDEFAVLFPELDYLGAESAMAKLQKEVYKFLEKKGFTITLSMGVVTYQKAKENPVEMLNQADHLRYQIKREGKNGIRHEVWPHSNGKNNGDEEKANES